MKKVLLNFLLVLVAILPLQAVETDSHDNRLYITIGESSDLSQVPITLYLENPTIAITAVEMYLTLPEGTVISTGTLDATRCTATHELTEGETSGGHFVSIVTPDLEPITGTDGAVCSWTCDLSGIADGDHTISALGMFAVGVEGDVVTSYTAQDQSEVFTKNGDMMTGIEEVKADEGKLVIYNLQGVRLKEPQKGQINIINGKKVIL